LWNNYKLVANNVDEVTTAYLSIPLEGFVKSKGNVIVRNHPSGHNSNFRFPKKQQ
jgi:hypothetical protein